MRVEHYKAAAFKDWLLARGADWRHPTNQYELARFWTHEGIGVVYTNSKGKVTFTGVAGAAYQAFSHNKSWRALPRAKDKRQERWQQWSLLSERDGPICCYCACELTYETYTLEHFLAKTSGGTNYYANLGLACESCNRDLGHAPVAQKIQTAILRRMKNAVLKQKQSAGSSQGLPQDQNGSGVHDRPLAQAPGAEPKAVSGRSRGRTLTLPLPSDEGTRGDEGGSGENSPTPRPLSPAPGD